MAVSVLLRKPRVDVTIIQHVRLTNNPVSSPISSAVLAPAIISVTTNRQMGDAGGFQIVLNLSPPPTGYLTPNGDKARTWKDVLLPMDAVQIVAEVDTPNGLVGEVIMRGFIDYVGMMANYSGGGPQRTIIIAGRDYHRILLSQVYFASGGQPNGMAIMDRWDKDFLQLQAQFDKINTERGQGDVQDRDGITAKKVMTILYDFYAAIFDELPNYFINTDTDGFNVETPNLYLAAIDGDPRDSDLETFDPAINLTNSEPFIGLKDIFEAYGHAPWREMFFDDYIEGGDINSYFIWRPTPWLNIDGGIIQFDSVDSLTGLKTYNGGQAWRITSDQLIEMSVGVDDSQVINFIATYPGIFTNLTDAAKVFGHPLESLAFGDNTNPAVRGLKNAFETSSYKLYTWKPYDFRTAYFDLNGGNDNTKQPDAVKKIGLKTQVWNQRLVDALGHQEMLDSGSCVIRGNPLIHMGHYVGIQEPGTPWPSGVPLFVLYYVAGVQHAFNYPREISGSQGSYTTTLSLTRGRSRLLTRMPITLTGP